MMSTFWIFMVRKKIEPFDLRTLSSDSCLSPIPLIKRHLANLITMLNVIKPM